MLWLFRAQGLLGGSAHPVEQELLAEREESILVELLLNYMQELN